MSGETGLSRIAGFPVRFLMRSYRHLATVRTEKRLPAGPDTIDLLLYASLNLVPIVALFFVPFSWQGIVALLGMNIVGIIGSEVADHRYFSHRPFKTSRWGEYFLAFCSGMVFQDSLFHWATDHKAHHRFSDNQDEYTDRDPHNSTKGLFHSFCGWLLMRSPHRDDLNAKRRRGRGLYEDRLLNMLQFLPFLWLCLFGILTGLYFFGGWTAIVYGIVGLIVFPSLYMFLVNSVGHGHGPGWLHTRDYDNGDRSTNVALLGFIGSGVGWHNHHHAFPWSARSGLERWQLDKAWLIIRCMEYCGIVRDVGQPTEEQKRLKKDKAMARTTGTERSEA